MTVGSKEVTLNLYDTAGECGCARRVLEAARRVSPIWASLAASLRGALTAPLLLGAAERRRLGGPLSLLGLSRPICKRREFGHGELLGHHPALKC